MHSNPTQFIIEHHFNSFVNNDLEALMSNYTENSKVIMLDIVASGLDEIRRLLTGAINNFPAGEAEIILDTLIVDGDLGYTIWHGETNSVVVPFSTATYLIQDGKIHRHTIGRITQAKTPLDQ
ncbi:MAG TPA: nuclear transport factor 2 family protein [Saprospiraceae bacterium]|nr:nuclear transport factor 2 family protein [Saprospiraceae bacterium]HNT19258.1 nuclear transport factor 2 family protein [Saprospiraceae bacterium]